MSHASYRAAPPRELFLYPCIRRVQDDATETYTLSCNCANAVGCEHLVHLAREIVTNPMG
jgi:hypothetical protein